MKTHFPGGGYNPHKLPTTPPEKDGPFCVEKRPTILSYIRTFTGEEMGCDDPVQVVVTVDPRIRDKKLNVCLTPLPGQPRNLYDVVDRIASILYQETCDNAQITWKQIADETKQGKIGSALTTLTKKVFADTEDTAPFLPERTKVYIYSPQTEQGSDKFMMVRMDYNGDFHTKQEWKYVQHNYVPEIVESASFDVQKVVSLDGYRAMITSGPKMDHDKI